MEYAADLDDREYGGGRQAYQQQQPRAPAPPPQFVYAEDAAVGPRGGDDDDDDNAGPPKEYGGVGARLLEALSLYTLCELCEARDVWARAPSAARAMALRRVQSGDDVSEAFAVAAAHGNSEALVWLLRYGCDVNFRQQAAAPDGPTSGITQRAPTPLMVAVGLRDEGDAVRTVDTLLSLGADVDAPDTHTMETALHGCDHPAVVSRLLDAGARPDFVSEQGLTPIGVAWLRVRHGPLQEFKRRFNYYTHRSLRAAVELHDFKVARDLLAEGARVDLRDWATQQSVCVMLAHAIMEGRRDLVERFLSMDVQQNGPDCARSGAGLVNARVWIESARAYLPLLHVAAYAGMEGAFTEATPPNADADDGGPGGGGGGGYGGGGGGGRSTASPMRARSRAPGGGSRYGGGGGGDDDDDGGGGGGGGPGSMRSPSPSRRAGGGGRLRYDDLLDGPSDGHSANNHDRIRRGGGDDDDDDGELSHLGASANPRQLRAQVAGALRSSRGGGGGHGSDADDHDDYRTPAKGGGGGARGHMMGSSRLGDGYGGGGSSSSRYGGGSPSPATRGRFGGGGGRGVSTLEPLEDADGGGMDGGGGDDEEDEATLARRKYRRLVRVLLSHGARLDAVVEWRLPALARRKRRGMRRYGDDSDDEDEPLFGGGRGGGGGGGGSGVRALVGTLAHASALHVAAYFGRVGFVQEWIAAGGPLELQAGGSVSTPLAVAEMEDRPAVVQLLRTAGADAHPRGLDYLRLEELKAAGGDPRELGATRRLVGGRLRRVLADGLAAARGRGGGGGAGGGKDGAYDFSPVLDALFALNGDALVDSLLRGQTFNPQKDEDIRMACGALLGQAVLGLRIDVLTALLQLDRAHNGVRGARGGGGIVNARLAFGRPDAPKPPGGPPLAVLTTPLHLLAEMSYNKREEGMKAGARARHEAMVSELLRFRPNPRSLAEPARVNQPYSLCPLLTALHLFAVHDDTAAIRLWGEADVPVDLEVTDVGTPLHLALRCGNVAAARALILAGSDVSSLCGPVPSPPVHRLVDFTVWVEAACDKMSAAAAAQAAAEGGELAAQDTLAACNAMRTVGARRLTLLTRLMKRAGANLSTRSYSGRTVVGAILSHSFTASAPGFMQHAVMNSLMPLFLEGRRDAWAMGTGVPLFQARLTGALWTAASLAAAAAGGGSPAGKKLLLEGGGLDEGASTVLDADSATFAGSDARTQAAAAATRRGGGAASRVAGEIAAAVGDGAGGKGLGGGGGGGDVPDNASGTSAGDDEGGGDEADGEAPALKASFAHRTDMVVAPTYAGGGGAPGSPAGRHALLLQLGSSPHLRDGGDGAARGPSSPYAVAAAVGLTGAYDGESAARDERDLVCELMPEGYVGGDGEAGGAPAQLTLVLALEVINAIAHSTDLWSDALQQCYLQTETEAESLPPPPPSRVDAYRMV